MPPSNLPVPRDEVGLRVRKARSIASARVVALAKTGASGGVLTPREMKEVCLAVVAEVEERAATGRRKTGPAS